jgi:hypothetical protein
LNQRVFVLAMFVIRTLLGGILAIMLGTATLAEWPVGGPETQTRPLSRLDAVELRTQSARSALVVFRPPVRPDYMVRYPVMISQDPTMRPVARISYIPEARWDFRDDSDSWTRAALSALRSHGRDLQDTVPRDIANWCPAYTENPPHLRRAFWVGMMSALVKHESTYRPTAVGGGNLWFGLMQIYPDTARRYGCHATTGEALKDPEDNLSCAIRIMNVTVPRDNAIAVRDSRWRGVAADWGPMTNRSKIAEMAAWTRRQDYCVSRSSIRPQARPSVQATLSTMNDSSAP